MQDRTFWIGYSQTTQNVANKLCETKPEDCQVLAENIEVDFNEQTLNTIQKRYEFVLYNF